MNYFLSIFSILIAVLLTTMNKKERKRLRKTIENIGKSKRFKNFNYGMVYLLVALSIPYACCIFLILLSKGYDIYSSLAISSVFPLSALHVLYRTHKLFE